MINWARRALVLLGPGRDAALVTVLAVEGSAPCEAGAKLLIWPEGQAGTIGGGNLEFRAAEQARKMLDRADVAYAVQDVPLGPFLRQCCGGRVRLLIERLTRYDLPWLGEAAVHVEAAQSFELRIRLMPGAIARILVPLTGHRAISVSFDDRPADCRSAKPGAGETICLFYGPPRAVLLLFGAGHVGEAIVKVVRPLPICLRWFDSRPEIAVGQGVIHPTPEGLLQAAGAAGPDDHVLILTHDHQLDYSLVSAVLSGNARYLGLIGSETKRARFLSQLQRDGFTPSDRRRLVCPIGLPGLRSKVPEVIAISVVADLLLRLAKTQTEAAIVPTTSSAETIRIVSDQAAEGERRCSRAECC